MKEFKISKLFIEAIKNQALNSENEIYGWLLGYEKEDIPNVLGIFECKSFDHQTLISAVPSAQEFQEMSSLLPQGIGPIGIYHSHPFSSEIFHSHTDDKTLISLSNQFPNCISIVTNGKEINYYRMGKNNKTKEIKPNFVHPKILNYILVKLNDEFIIKVDKQILNEEYNNNNINIKIINKFREYFEENWEHSQFLINGKQIEKSQKMENYLKKTHPQSIVFKIAPLKQDKKNSNILIISNNEKKVHDRDFKILSCKINAEIPIYLKEENIRFKRLEDTIKTELISNNILQKLFHSKIDINQEEVILPEDFFIHYFGFLIRVLIFQYPSFNDNNLSQKNELLIEKLISQLNPFIGLDLPIIFNEFFKKFLIDISELSIHFKSVSDINEQLKVFRTKLKLK